MRAEGRAFFSDASYRLAGVLLRKEAWQQGSQATLEQASAGSEDGGSSGDERSGGDRSSIASAGLAPAMSAVTRACVRLSWAQLVLQAVGLQPDRLSRISFVFVHCHADDLQDP